MEYNLSTSLNPFIYSTPDQIVDPQQALNLFVDVFKDFHLIESPGNSIINGARGSGKSMMFRIMRPDCQKQKLQLKLSELNYYAIYIPVKDTSLNIQELEFLKDKHGENIFNEHLMSTYFSIAIFKCLSEENCDDYQHLIDEVKLFYDKTFLKLLRNIGYQHDEDIDISAFNKIEDVFFKIIETLENILESFSTYIQRLSLGPENLSYVGPLCLYRNFLLPILKEVQKFSFLPKNKPLYLLVDDADLLNYAQTKILNSWVSFRSTSIVCFKITTQLNYKTFYTTSSNRIDSPHDYHEINFSDIYTSNLKGRYKENIKDMVERRLKFIANINVKAEDFFPCNTQQQEDYKKVFDLLKEEKGYDYAYRNARSDYMLSLTNKYTYSYSGFDQLVHLSSGIIRNFIDLSFKMFDKTLRESQNQMISYIPVSIQDEEILEYSNWTLSQLDKSIDDKELHSIQVSKYRSLKNLINSLGKAFRLFLESTNSERRKFSFYYDGEIDPKLKDVLRLGKSEGLLHYSTHGSKTGLGRSHKYVLNRILSPVYQLDPFSFSGYLYLTPEKIALAIHDERKFLSYIKDRIKNPSDEDEQKQLTIDF